MGKAKRILQKILTEVNPSVMSASVKSYAAEAEAKLDELVSDWISLVADLDDLGMQKDPGYKDVTVLVDYLEKAAPKLTKAVAAVRKMRFQV